MTGRRWPWLVLAIGAVLAAGTAIVALDPERGPQGRRDEAVTPALTPITLPFDLMDGAPRPPVGPVVAPAGSSAGAVSGQSVVGPGRPSAPVPSPGNPALLLDAETVRGADLQVSIAAGTYADAFERALSIGPAYGGFVASSSSTLDDDASTGQLVLRVPVAHFDAARRAVADLGEVENETVRGQDVSAQLVDQEARQRSLEVQEEALRALVGKATTVGEVLQIQPALTSVRQQIEQLRAQRTRLEDAAAMSTILVTLREPDARSAGRTDSTETGLARRLEQAANGSLAVIGGIIVALGWAFPVVALGALGYAIVAFAQRWRRRQA